jgi:hypothetical protein
MLALAAQEADIVGLTVPTTRQGLLDFRSCTFEATAQKIAYIRAMAGERFEQLEINILVLEVMITNTPLHAAQQLLEVIRPYADPERLIPAEQLLESPNFLIGTNAQIIERLERYRAELGISYFATRQAALEPFAPIASQLAGT